MHNSIPSNTNHCQIKIQSCLFLCKEDSNQAHSNLFKITALKSIRCKGNQKKRNIVLMIKKIIIEKLQSICNIKVLFYTRIIYYTS